MNFEQQLDVYLRSRFTLIILITSEEERLIELVRSLCEKTQRPCLSWDIADDFTWLANSTGVSLKARDPITALEQIDNFDDKKNTIFILKDFHDAWGNPQVKRKLRSVSQK